MFLRLIEAVLAIAFMAFLIFEIALPLMLRLPLCPSFRREAKVDAIEPDLDSEIRMKKKALELVRKGATSQRLSEQFTKQEEQWKNSKKNSESGSTSSSESSHS